MSMSVPTIVQLEGSRWPPRKFDSLWAWFPLSAPEPACQTDVCCSLCNKLRNYRRSYGLMTGSQESHCQPRSRQAFGRFRKEFVLPATAFIENNRVIMQMRFCFCFISVGLASKHARLDNAYTKWRRHFTSTVRSVLGNMISMGRRIMTNANKTSTGCRSWRWIRQHLGNLSFSVYSISFASAVPTRLLILLGCFMWNHQTTI